MSKKIILLMIMLLVLGSFTVCYAAEESPVTENVITLEQAITMAQANSRSMEKYELDVDKTKYQLYQVEEDRVDADYEYISMTNLYDLLNQKLQEDPGNTDLLKRINDLREQIDSQYDRVVSSGDAYEDAQYSHDDSIVGEENYRKQLDYIVEELYTAILNQENSLLSLNKEYHLGKILLAIEKSKLGLGGSSQLKVNEMDLKVINLNKSILEATNDIKVKKGQLNDIMGRDYDDELNLTPFEVEIAAEITGQEQLYSSALQEYSAIKEIKRDIEESEEILDDEDDYYAEQILKIELEEKKLQLEDEKINLNKSITDLISDTQSKQEDYKISLKNYENAKKSYEWDKQRFEMGVISKIALQESELNFINSKNKKDSSGYTLYLAQRSLKLAEEGIVN